MMKTRKQENASVSLPLETSLHHRGGFGPPDGPLFPPPGTLEAVGGTEAVARLVDRLYDRFETDPVLRPAFGRDLTNEREKVKRFFEAWFGGSQAYFDADWPPGLIAAHGPISISRGMAGRWVGHFLDSLGEVVTDRAAIARVKPLISRLAMGLVNRDSEPVPGERLHFSCYHPDPKFLRAVRSDDAEAIATAAAERPPMFAWHGPRLLLVAAVRGKARAAGALLRAGVDANAPALLPGGEASANGLPSLYISALCGALSRNRHAAAKLLIDSGARYDIFTAAFLGDVDGARNLLDAAPELADAIDPVCDVARITPLMHAVSNGHAEVARLLLERGATVGANSVRLVKAAANAGHEALTELLLAHGADASPIGPGLWVLHPGIAEKLLARGANVNRTTGRSWVSLCCTGNSGHKENPELARAFLRCGADVSVRYGGNTALHCAAKAGFAQVAAALIEYGAAVNALNDRGQTPLDLVEEAARSIDREPIRRLLISHGAR